MMKREKCRNLVLATVALAAMLLTVGCAGSSMLNLSVAPDAIVPASRLGELDGPNHGSDVIFCLEPGDSFPLHIDLKTDFLAFKQETIDVVAKKKLYFMIRMPAGFFEKTAQRLKALGAKDIARMEPEQLYALMAGMMVYISADARRWAPLDGSPDYREVLGFDSGSVSFGMAAMTGKPLEASLIIETVKKGQ